MAIVLLASVSLFALVVTGHPMSPDSDRGELAPSTLRNTFQAPFQILPERNNLKFDAARLHPQNHKQQTEDFPKLNAENIVTVSSLEISPGVHPSLGTPMDEIVDRQDASDTNEFNDSWDSHVTDEPTSSQLVVDEQQETHTNGPSTAPFAVLAFSCVAASLALVCIALTLYVIKSLRFQMLASKTAWQLLPRFWKCPKSEADTSEAAKKRILGRSCLLPSEVGQRCFLNIERQSTRRHDVHMEDKPLYSDAVSDIESEWDDGDEKYQDALDMTPLPFVHDLPNSESERYDDPPLLAMGTNLLDQPTSNCGAPVICETSSSPISRPAWSVRAIDSPALGFGLVFHEDRTIGSAPQPFFHPHRRAYRSAVPEFDIALAMQLRPGIGIGADSAWMVRFLMAIFGWFAVALTGNTR